MSRARNKCFSATGPHGQWFLFRTLSHPVRQKLPLKLHTCEVEVVKQKVPLYLIKQLELTLSRNGSIIGQSRNEVGG